MLRRLPIALLLLTAACQQPAPAPEGPAADAPAPSPWVRAPAEAGLLELDGAPASSDDDDDDDATPADPDPAECPDPAEPWPEGPFADVSACAGVDFASSADFECTGAGPSLADRDGDGDLDLYLVTTDGANLLLDNDGSGRFVPSPASPSVALPDALSHGSAWADYDNDGDPDLYVLNRGPNALLRNDGPDGFTDVTDAAGVGEPGQGIGAAWGDYDGDGHLDLYVVNWICQECDWLASDHALDRLYRALGDGTFEDASDALGLPYLRGGPGYGAVWFDADGDGDLDLYVANDKGSPEPDEPDGVVLWRNALFRNDGAGCGGHCFTERAIGAGADLRIFSMGVAAADYDGDGDLDLAMSDDGPPRLLQNLGTGDFVEVSLSSGLTDIDTVEGWGIAWVDYDNDGGKDLFWADGPLLDYDRPNRLARNLGDGTFAAVELDAAAEGGATSVGVARGDYDGDGWVDLVTGDRQGEPYRLLRNVAFAGIAADDAGWTAVLLAGGGPVNRDAIGARVSLTLDDGRVLVAEVRAGSSMGSSHDPALHFGLGGALAVSAEIRWPDGTVEIVADVPVGQRWTREYGSSP